MRRLDHCESYHVQESIGILRAQARHDGLPLLKEHRHGDASDTTQRQMAEPQEIFGYTHTRNRKCMQLKRCSSFHIHLDVRVSARSLPIEGLTDKIKTQDTISRTHTSSCLIIVKWGCVESGRYTHRSGLTLRILGNGTLQIHISISVETGFLSLVLSFLPVSFFQFLAFLMPLDGDQMDTICLTST